jgi:glycosyltransferase involved in cell wall biosynthesis
MRVVIASSGLGHVARGVEAWAADLGGALARRGLDVTLCKGGGDASAPHERVLPCWRRDSDPARWVTRSLPRGLAWRLGLASGYGVEQTTFAWSLIGYLRSQRVDLLHVQDPRVALLVQRAHRLGLVPTRTILAHGTEEPAAFLRKIRYVQHLAPWHEQECRAQGAGKPAWACVPNFIDTDRFSPALFPLPRDGGLRSELGIPPGALVALTVAAIKRKHKRIDAVLEEFARLRTVDPGLPAWLVVAGGREEDTEELVSLGREMLGDRVRFLVRFPRERMAELYAAADLFILGSVKEMMPIAVLEASASGLPCIVNRHPVLEWMVGPGGSTIDMAAPGALAAALGALLGDADERRRRGELARSHCVRHFSEDAVVGRILDYYRRVLADGSDAKARGTSRGAVAPRRSAHAPCGSSVSVVIPAFNSGPWIADAVRSVLAQTAPPAEIFVVDDGSTDDTRRRLIPYMDRIRYVHQDNQGVAAARNLGIERSTGEFVAFLDADDAWHPRKLELQLCAFAEHPEIGLMGTAVYEWPTPSIPELQAPPKRPAVLPWWRLAVRNALTTSSVLVRRSVLDQVGRFDPSLHGPEDYDLWLRVAESTTVANLDLPLVGYRTVQGSLGRRPLAMEAGLRRIHQKLDERRAWRGRWLLRRKAHSYCRYSCAYLYGAAGDQRTALARLLGSMAGYPFPYRASEVRLPLARLRMLTMILLRMVRSPNGAGWWNAAHQP